MSKKRLDLGVDGKPLSDNPFGSLAGLNEGLRQHAEPETNPVVAEQPAEPRFRVERTRKGGLPVFVERRAKGKVVTVVRNVSGDTEFLLKTLKKRCGAGGVIREGDVEIQGDHRASIETFLQCI